MKASKLYPFVLALLLVVGITLWLNRGKDQDGQEESRPATPESAEIETTSLPSPEEEAAPALREDSIETQEETARLSESSNFEDWMNSPRPVEPTAEAAWLEQGKALALERREVIAHLIMEDPEQAVLAAISPRIRARLPAEVVENLEELVIDEGFYGVLATCFHGPGDEHVAACEISQEVVLKFGTFDARIFQASIYGQRERRLTEESASINGVAVDGQIALHEFDAIIFDDGEAFAPNRFAVYYRGEEHLAETLEEAKELQFRFQRSPDGLF